MFKRNQKTPDTSVTAGSPRMFGFGRKTPGATATGASSPLPSTPLPSGRVGAVSPVKFSPGIQDVHQAMRESFPGETTQFGDEFFQSNAANPEFYMIFIMAFINGPGKVLPEDSRQNMVLMLTTPEKFTPELALALIREAVRAVQESTALHRVTPSASPITYRGVAAEVVDMSFAAQIREVDVPAVGNCLYCAVIIGALVPHLADARAFGTMAQRLFPHLDAWQAEKLRDAFRNFNGLWSSISLAELDDLVQLFREHVVNHIARNMDGYIDGFRAQLVADGEQTIDLEKHFAQYLLRQKQSGTWGGGLELTAIQRMLKMGIDVTRRDADGVLQVAAPAADGFRPEIQLVLVGSQGMGNHYHVLIHRGHLYQASTDFTAGATPGAALEALLGHSGKTNHTTATFYFELKARFLQHRYSFDAYFLADNYDVASTADILGGYIQQELCLNSAKGLILSQHISKVLKDLLGLQKQYSGTRSFDIAGLCFLATYAVIAADAAGEDLSESAPRRTEIFIEFMHAWSDMHQAPTSKEAVEAMGNIFDVVLHFFCHGLSEMPIAQYQAPAQSMPSVSEFASSDATTVQIDDVIAPEIIARYQGFNTLITDHLMATLKENRNQVQPGYELGPKTLYYFLRIALRDAFSRTDDFTSAFAQLVELNGLIVRYNKPRTTTETAVFKVVANPRVIANGDPQIKPVTSLKKALESIIEAEEDATLRPQDGANAELVTIDQLPEIAPDPIQLLAMPLPSDREAMDISTELAITLEKKMIEARLGSFMKLKQLLETQLEFEYPEDGGKERIKEVLVNTLHHAIAQSAFQSFLQLPALECSIFSEQGPFYAAYAETFVLLGKVFQRSDYLKAPRQIEMLQSFVAAYADTLTGDAVDVKYRALCKLIQILLEATYTSDVSKTSLLWPSNESEAERHLKNMGDILNEAGNPVALLARSQFSYHQLFIALGKLLTDSQVDLSDLSDEIAKREAQRLYRACQASEWQHQVSQSLESIPAHEMGKFFALKAYVAELKQRVESVEKKSKYQPKQKALDLMVRTTNKYGFAFGINANYTTEGGEVAILPHEYTYYSLAFLLLLNRQAVEKPLKDRLDALYQLIESSQLQMPLFSSDLGADAPEFKVLLMHKTEGLSAERVRQLKGIFEEHAKKVEVKASLYANFVTEVVRQKSQRQEASDRGILDDYESKGRQSFILKSSSEIALVRLFMDLERAGFLEGSHKRTPMVRKLAPIFDGQEALHQYFRQIFNGALDQVKDFNEANLKEAVQYLLMAEKVEKMARNRPWLAAPKASPDSVESVLALATGAPVRKDAEKMPDFSIDAQEYLCPQTDKGMHTLIQAYRFELAGYTEHQGFLSSLRGQAAVASAIIGSILELWQLVEYCMIVLNGAPPPAIFLLWNDMGDIIPDLFGVFLLAPLPIVRAQHLNDPCRLAHQALHKEIAEQKERGFLEGLRSPSPRSLLIVASALLLILGTNFLQKVVIRNQTADPEPWDFIENFFGSVFLAVAAPLLSTIMSAYQVHAAQRKAHLVVVTTTERYAARTPRLVPQSSARRLIDSMRDYNESGHHQGESQQPLLEREMENSLAQQAPQQVDFQPIVVAEQTSPIAQARPYEQGSQEKYAMLAAAYASAVYRALFQNYEQPRFTLDAVCSRAAREPQQDVRIQSDSPVPTTPQGSGVSAFRQPSFSGSPVRPKPQTPERKMLSYSSPIPGTPFAGAAIGSINTGGQAGMTSGRRVLVRASPGNPFANATTGEYGEESPVASRRRTPYTSPGLGNPFATPVKD